MFKSFGVSICGKSHIRRNLPNQDSFFCSDRLIAVSDGVGSAELSNIGSEAAVNSAAAVYKTGTANPLQFAECLHRHWLSCVNPQIIRQYAATCLFAALAEDNILIGRLGDGIAAVLFKDQSRDLICEEDKERSYANMTDALRDIFEPHLWQTFTFPAEEIAAVIICTDGISDRLRSETKTAFFRHIYDIAMDCSDEETVPWAKEWVSEWHSETGDDKTIVFFMTMGG